jgi:hypothetical protein
MSRRTCDQLGVCQGIACATCPSAQPLPKPAPGRDTDAENLAQWQNALLLQALAERADAEERERIAKVSAPLRHGPQSPRNISNAEFLRELLIYTAFFWAVIGLAFCLF